MDQEPVSPPICPNDDLAVQNKHVFWDNQHPTTAAHALLAKAAIAAVTAAVLAAGTP
jgi:phospholipase/lecithinase/hemolysin